MNLPWPFHRRDDETPAPNQPVGYFWDNERMIWRHHEEELRERRRQETLERRLELERRQREAPSMDRFERRPSEVVNVANLPMRKDQK